MKGRIFYFFVAMALIFISGAAWGAHEAFMHHWYLVHAKFPGLSDWWNPAESWRYKYKGGIYENGRNWVPIWFTDAKHILGTIYPISIAAGFFVAGIEFLHYKAGSGKIWKFYALWAIGLLAAYSIGNYIVYDVILH